MLNTLICSVVLLGALTEPLAAQVTGKVVTHVCRDDDARFDVSDCVSSRPGNLIEKIVVEGEGCRATRNESLCSDAAYTDPFFTTVSMDRLFTKVLKDANDPDPNMNPRIDIVVIHNDVVGVRYRRKENGNGYIVGGTNNNGPNGEIAAGTANIDAIAHEYAHAYVDAANREFYQAGQRDAEGKTAKARASNALNEGLADAIASTWAVVAKRAAGAPGSDETIGAGAGDPWVSGDGTNALDPKLRRDFKASLTFEHLKKTHTQRVRDPKTGTVKEVDNPQERGRAYAHFFYRLSLQPPFSTNPEKLLRLALATADNVRDPGQDGYDVADFLAAVEKAAMIESAQLAAVKNVTKELQPERTADIPPTNPPDPGPTSRPTPGAPTGLVVTAQLGCGTIASRPNVLQSGYRMEWNPTPTAVDYDVFSRNGGVEEFKAKVTLGPAADIATNFPTAFTVRACNESGCGPLSPESVNVDNRLCDPN